MRYEGTFPITRHKGNLPSTGPDGGFPRPLNGSAAMSREARMVFPLGSLVNGLAIAAGGLAGLLLGARLPERIRLILFQGLGLCVMVLGIQAALNTARPVIMIGSIVIGSVTGELLRLEDRLGRLSELLKARLRSSNPRFTEGLLSASVIFCIGAMGILGSFEEGLRGSRDIVYAKSIIDGCAAMAMASAMGIGVAVSGAAVFLYQGLLVIFAGALSVVITPPVMTELTAVGGVIILGIGINMLNLLAIRLANMIPALVVVVILASVLIR